MAQWGKLLKLEPESKSRVIRLYHERKVPIEIRRSLIKCNAGVRFIHYYLLKQQAEDYFQTQSPSKFINHFEWHPVELAGKLSECLREEKLILDSRVVDQDKKTGGTVNSLSVIHNCTALLVVLHCVILQALVDRFKESVTIAAQIVQTLVSVELPDWKRRQQMSCIGNPVNTSLHQLEKWFTSVGEMLLQIVQQLMKLQTNDMFNMSDVLQKYNEFTAALLMRLFKKYSRTMHRVILSQI
uniref:STAT transcription factor all-alpha domain-containing protein n=1 Tax=Neogobius melanostomus TaxID=47308 RepID=A0A8C6WY47_9GOBI